MTAASAFGGLVEVLDGFQESLLVEVVVEQRFVDNAQRIIGCVRLSTLHDSPPSWIGRGSQSSRARCLRSVSSLLAPLSRSRRRSVGPGSEHASGTAVERAYLCRYAGGKRRRMPSSPRAVVRSPPCPPARRRA